MAGKSITLNDIAERLNVSRVTVSKALRNHPDISDEMKAKVRKVAEQIGYVPNYIARNLSSKKSHTIGLLVPKIAHHFYSNCIEAIYEAAYDKDYDIIMTVSQENPQHERQHIQTLLSMKVDGILASITENTADDSGFEVIRKRSLPLVFFDRVFDNSSDNFVITNDREASFQLIEHCIKSGYKKIAHFTGYKHLNVGLEREKGYRDAMQKYNVKIRKDWVVHGGINEQAGYEGLKKLASLGELPEIIYAFTFPVALGIYTAAKELGILIPEQLEVVCFGVGKYNRYLSSAMTYVNQPADEIGRQALELLIQKIENFNEKAEHIVIPSQLRVCQKMPD